MESLRTMTIEALQHRHAELVEQAQVINDRIEAENYRALTDAEKKEWNAIDGEAAAIKRELDMRCKAESIEVLTARAGLDSLFPITRERAASGKKFREFLTGPASMLTDGVAIELRESITATGTADVAGVIPVLVQDFIEPLNKGLIINQLGLKMMTGLKSNVKYPIMPSFEAKFVDEKERVASTEIRPDDLSPKPRRIAVKVPLTELANIQTDGRLYSWILNNLATAVARTMNRWMFQTTPIVTGVHGAMSYDASVNKIQQVGDLDLTYKALVGLRGKVQGKGAYNDGTYAYIMSGELAAQLESTRRFDSGDTPILVDGKIGGVPVLLSEFIEATGEGTLNESPKHIGFGRWSDAIVGQFGDMRLTIDPYTGADADTTYLILNTYWSVDLIRKESFVIGTLKA